MAAGSPKQVRKILASGEIKTYSYNRDLAPHPRDAAPTLPWLIGEYRRSREWTRLRPRTQAHRLRYLRLLDSVPLALPAVTRRVVIRWRDDLAADRGDQTANQFVKAIRALFTWAIDREHIETNPVVRIRPFPGGSWRAWTADEYARLVPQLPEPLRRVAIVARYTGQRRGDLCAVQWGQYDGRVIRLTPEKGNRRIVLVIPVAAALRRELDAWRVVPLPTAPILTTATGRPWNPSYLSKSFCHALRAIDPAAAKLNVHGFRKLAAATLAEMGASDAEIMSVTGHTTTAMVRLYTASASQERLAAAAIARLDAAARKPRRRLTTADKNGRNKLKSLRNRIPERNGDRPTKRDGDLRPRRRDRLLFGRRADIEHWSTGRLQDGGTVGGASGCPPPDALHARLVADRSRTELLRQCQAGDRKSR